MTVTNPTRNGRSAPGRPPTALELIRRADATPEPSPAKTSPPQAPSSGFSPEQVAALAAPLDRANVRQREQGRGKVNYLEGWQLIAEANRIFGFDGWQRQTIAVRCVAQGERTIGRDQKPGWGVTYTARVRVTVTAGGLPPLIREGTGAGHGIDTDLGQAHESAIKEAETDAMKRALMTFGNPFGLALYDKQQREVTGASGAPTSSGRLATRPATAPQPAQEPTPSGSTQHRAASPAGQAAEPAHAHLSADTIQQLHSTLRSLPRPLLDSLTQGFRRRFQVPDSAVTIADRITLQCHHDWIEAFLVSHREVR
jgi:DNA recombination protein Rad52